MIAFQPMEAIMTKQEQWQHHINNWKASSLSQKEFCNQNDLKFYTFQYWLRKTSPPNVDRHAKPFIPVSIPPTSHCEIQLGSCLIRMPSNELVTVLSNLKQQGLLDA